MLGLIGTLASVVGGLIGIGIANRSAKKNTEMAINKQYTLNEQAADNAQKRGIENFNLYSSLKAQRGQIENAGLSASMLYGGSGGGGMGNLAPQGAGASAAVAPIYDIMQPMAQLGNLGVQMAQIKNLNADTDKKKSETEGISTDNIIKQIEVDITKNDLDYKKAMTYGIQLDNEFKRIQNEYAEAKEVADIEQAYTSIMQVYKAMDMIDEELKGKKIENSYLDKKQREEIKNLMADTAAKNMNAKLTQSQIELNDKEKKILDQNIKNLMLDEQFKKITNKNQQEQYDIIKQRFEMDLKKANVEMTQAKINTIVNAACQVINTGANVADAIIPG